jgi:transposase
VSEPLGLLAKHPLLRLSGLYKINVELHDYGIKAIGHEARGKSNSRRGFPCGMSRKEPHMKKRSIFQQQSQDLLRIFEEAGTSKKVLVVAMDYAKKDHTIMFCNGNGDVLRKPFSVKNTPEGVDYLVEQVRKIRAYHKIKKQHVFFGGEDCASYTENFTQRLRQQGWLVAGVNAHDAKKQRENMQASTDRLDLLGIARMLINRRGNCSPSQSGAYRNLRTLVRHRRKLVRLTTEEQNRMHCVVDRLFPGFLEERKSGLTPFQEPSLRVMEGRFSAAQIMRRKRSTLMDLLARAGAQKPEEKAQQLQAYAANVLQPSKEYISTLQTSLTQHVRLYRCLAENISSLEREMAIWLAQTQGAFLMTVRGIGLVLASGVSAEIGNPATQKPVGNLTSYAGIIPRVSQTGGTEGNTHVGSVAKRCNRIFKDYLVQSASHLGLHGAEDLMADHKRRAANGQHANFGIARRYLRIGMHLMRHSYIYLPENLRGSATFAARRAYYQTIWSYLLDKWKRYDAHEVAFAPENPLGQWRDVVQNVYNIKLKIK